MTDPFEVVFGRQAKHGFQTRLPCQLNLTPLDSPPFGREAKSPYPSEEMGDHSLHDFRLAGRGWPHFVLEQIATKKMSPAARGKPSDQTNNMHQGVPQPKDQPGNDLQADDVCPEDMAKTLRPKRFARNNPRG